MARGGGLSGRSFGGGAMRGGSVGGRSFAAPRSFGAPMGRSFGAPMGRNFGAPMGRNFAAPMNRNFGRQTFRGIGPQVRGLTPQARGIGPQVRGLTPQARGIGPQVRGFRGQPGMGLPGRAISPSQVRPLQPQSMRGFLSTRPQVGRMGRVPGLPTRQVAGSPTTLNRFRSGDPGFRSNVNTFGHPNNRFTFSPRHHGDFDNDFFHRGRFHDRDDFFFHRHHGFIDNDFFFDGFFANPWWWGFGFPGFWPSVYSMWGWSPGWIQPNYGYYQPSYYQQPVTYPSYPTTNYYDYRSYTTEGGAEVAPEAVAPQPQAALDVAGVNRALEDIHQAWVTGKLDPLAAHLSDQVDIQVFFDGKYRYTTGAKNYAAMTLDNLSTTRTDSLVFDTPIWISATEVYVTGRQVFTDPDKVQQTMYLSYRLQQVGTDWYIDGFGSGRQPIKSDYRDFRY